MKKLFTQLLLCAMFIVPTLLFSQNLSGTVHSVLNVGAYDYSYIYVEDQGVYYKTAAYSQGLLILNMNADISIGQVPNSEFNAYVTSEDVQIGVYATRIETENFLLPLSSNYGMPILENEILFFSNDAHFEEFYDILDGFAQSPYEEMIDLLHVFENQYIGYTSFNSMLEREFNWEDGEFTDAQMNLRGQQDYLKDYTLKALVNEYGEVGIGSEILTMTSDLKGEIIYTYVLDESQLSELNEKRDISIYDQNFVHLAPIVGAQYKGDMLIGKSQVSVVYYSTANGDSEITYKSSLEVVQGLNQCNPTQKGLTIKLTADRTWPNGETGLIGLDASNFSGIVDVQWGDGTFQTFNLSAPGNIGSEINLVHTYPSGTSLNPGIYTIITSMYFDAETTTIQAVTLTDSTGVYVSSGSCSAAEITPGKETYFLNGGNNKMVAETWAKNFFKWKTIGSSTDAFRKKNNGNWKKCKGNIQANIYYVLRHYAVCGIDVTGSECDSGYKKHIQSKKSHHSGYIQGFQFRIGNGDTYSQNYYEKNNETVSTTINLDACP